MVGLRHARLARGRLILEDAVGKALICMVGLRLSLGNVGLREDQDVSEKS